MHTASSTIRRRLAAAAPIVVAGLALVGCGGASTPGAGGAAEPATTESAAAGTETQAPAEEAPVEEAQPTVGQTVSIEGWDFTVVSVGAPQESVGAAPFGNDAAGIYLPVTVTITNTGSQAEFLSSDAVAVLDANGAEYSSDSVASIYDDSAIQLGELNPGITLTGPVYFDVPDGTVPTSVSFTPGLFGGETITVAL